MSIIEIGKMAETEIANEQKLKYFMESRLEIMPPGSLSISTQNNHNYYTQVIQENGNRTSIYRNPRSSEDREIISLLMEKRNITYGLPILNNNLKLLEPLEKLKDYNPLSTRFGAQLGNEYYLDDEVCVRDWLNEKYTRNPYKPEHLIYETKSGELVRSKSEMMIADILTEYSIPYKLEKPLNVKGKLIYPDFELLHIPTRKLFWWEHFGKLDDPKYVLKNLNRIDDLADCGIIIEKNLIITWESDGCPLTRGVIIKKLKRHSFI